MSSDNTLFARIRAMDVRVFAAIGAALLLIAGVMCVVGIIGPAVNHIALRQIGIIGYAIVWPIVCVPLSNAFRQEDCPPVRSCVTGLAGRGRAGLGGASADPAEGGIAAAAVGPEYG